MRVFAVLLLLMTSLTGSLGTEPTDLHGTVEAFAAALGHEVDTSALDRLSIPAQRAIDAALGQLLACHDLSQSLLADLEISAAADLHGKWAGVMRDCMELSVPLVQAAAAASTEEPAVDLWPVVLLETQGQNNVYRHDYVLLIDMGGDDAYYNNAGGNVLDVTSGPDTERAVGCENVAQALAAECAISASAFVDVEGDDVYGELEKPNTDRRCTPHKLVRRMVIQGAGVAGVGILVDKLGNDTYTGKTVSQGAGHVFGAGYHREEKGDDSYLAIRQSQGAGLVGGFGFLDDLGGNDVYDHYMPRGGVIDDTDVCDDVPRYTLGAGTLGGVGFFNGEGSPSVDEYHGSDKSMGFADTGATGLFHDRLGDDAYDGPPGVGNDRTLTNTFSDTGVNIFMDHETG